MTKTFGVIVLIVSIVFSSSGAWAQATGTNIDKPPSGGPRRQLATIIYAGLGGAVLGLSTLSFYGRPQDKLANIAIGFAVGVIVGTVAVTYSAATNPGEFYGQAPQRDDLLGPAPEMSVLKLAAASSDSEISTSLNILTF